MAISVALLTALAALWARSAVADDHLSFAAANRRFYVGTAGGCLYLRGQLSLEKSLTIDAPDTRPVRASLGALFPAYRKELLSRTLHLPLWLIALPAAILPARAAWAAWARANRRRPSRAARPQPRRQRA